MMNQTLALDQILEAVIFATHQHNNQKRKDQQRSPYITHPLSVAKAIWQIGEVHDVIILTAAILHDTIEDTDATAPDLREAFGDQVLAIVLEVTDNKSLCKIERKRLQVVHAANLSQPAKIVKLADKLMNCRDILHTPPNHWPLERRQEYIQWAADVVVNMRGTNEHLETAFDEVLNLAEKLLTFKIEPFETIDQRPWAPHPANPSDHK